MTLPLRRKRLSARIALLIVAYTKPTERERHFFGLLADEAARQPWSMTAAEALH